jgi:hypothetical protein
VAPGTEKRRKQQQAAAAPKQRQPANKAHISEAGQVCFMLLLYCLHIWPIALRALKVLEFL